MFDTAPSREMAPPAIAVPILEVVGVEKRFGAFAALHGVSIEVARGEFLALVGPSGCGKTTLLKQIAGFETPSAGAIRMDGRDVTLLPAARRPTSMVFQKLALFPHMTVAENIGFPLRLRREQKAIIDARVRAMVDLMQLNPDYLARYPRQLSGGEQQRVALARAMIASPEILLLDEPLSALDVKLKKVLQAELKRLHRSLGVTFVHVTHDLEEAMMLADRICVMRGGRILQVGTPQDIYYRPADAFVAGFIGETNLLPVTVEAIESGTVRFHAADFADQTGMMPRIQACKDIAIGPGRLMVRPELIRPADAAADCRLEARVVEIFNKGGTTQFRCETQAGSPLVVEMASASVMPARIGETLALGWTKADTFLLPGAER